MTQNNNDMFSLYSSRLVKDSLRGKVNLESDDIPEISVPGYFQRHELPPVGGNYYNEIRNFISPLAKECEEKGFGGNVFTALYEAVLNAYTHGNNFDDSKSVLVGSNIKGNNLELIIADEGEELHPEFTRFILAHRERTSQTSNFINWYSFADTNKKDPNNNGTGTSFMHAYVDNVLYFKSQDLGGLAVYLKKSKSK